MRATFLAILICLAGAAGARADDSVRQAEVAAAVADAQNSLRQQILATEIQPGLTVGDLLARVGSAQTLQPAWTKAQQIGGTRWIDDQTCQIQLELDGSAVQQALLKAAADRPDLLPLPLADLRTRLDSWATRSFSGTGTSTALAAAEQLRPSDQQQAWTTVSEADRRSAIAAARRSAAGRVLDSIRPITMPDGKTLGEAIEEPGVESAVSGWLADRPITQVEFRDDLEVRLTIAVDPVDFWQMLRGVLPRQKQVALPPGDAGWKRLREQVELRMADPIGRSVVTSSAAPTTRATVTVPEVPPDWAGQSMDAEGTSRSTGALLHTARAAEAKADERLAAKVNDLLLAPGLTIGEAGRQDPRIAEAVSRALERAKLFKVDYDYPEAGAVRVKVNLELEDVWREVLNR
jgi:hypothetical protein